MYFPALVLGLRRLGRWLGMELLQLSLWVAVGLSLLAGLRSAWGGGAGLRAEWAGGPPVRPRRSGAASSSAGRRGHAGGRTPFSRPAAA